MTFAFPRLETGTLAEQLNRSCFCVTTKRDELLAAMARETGGIALPEHMFSDVPVYLPADTLRRMQATVRAIEAMATLPVYRAIALARAPAIAHTDYGPRGALMGYDFHVENGVPRLIEINTNAGGSALNALLLAAQRACCPDIETLIDPASPVEFEASVAGMFHAEWQTQRSAKPLRRVAIIDDAPEHQYLYPEFLLFQHMLERRGIEAVIADATCLTHEGGVLYASGKPVDLVYNRLVDFSLSEPHHAALREAYEAGAVVVTPNPHVHALLADKRNLVTLSDPEFAAASGLSQDHVAALATIPRTRPVDVADAAEFWRTRRDWFFKPQAGHGGKAVYRGDKLTRGVFSTILEGGYVAQQFAAPGERTIRRDDIETVCKADIRLYTYGGELLLLGARLYQGQTTNFRTPGGGFAPIYVV